MIYDDLTSPPIARLLPYREILDPRSVAKGRPPARIFVAPDTAVPGRALRTALGRLREGAGKEHHTEGQLLRILRYCPRVTFRKRRKTLRSALALCTCEEQSR